MTIIENSGEINFSDSEDMEDKPKSAKDSPDISDEDLIMELDNMLEEDSGLEIKSDAEVTEDAALDIGMPSSEVAADFDDDIIDLGESLEPESIGLDQSGLSEEDSDTLLDDLSEDDIIDLSDEEHIEDLVEELDEESLIELDEFAEDGGFDQQAEGGGEDDLLEIEDLVSDESLQYDPLLSKSKTDDLYIEENVPTASKSPEEYDDIDILADYESGYEEDMGLEITSDMDISEDSFSIAESSVVSGLSIEQIESAVERVVTRLFMDKMETMLAEVMERVVREELANLKERLLGDQPKD